MYLKPSLAFRYVVAAVVGAVVFSEWLVYTLQPITWRELKCAVNDTTCVKVLFVADPQIQGVDAAPWPLNELFIWDSDRYLTETFSVVLNHFKPNVIVYLGDLMDEGSICTMKQYYTYLERLMKIFNINYQVTQVWLPGDNDIGGEHEPIRKDKVNEFNKVFIRPPIVEYRDIAFIEVNAITHTIPEIKPEDIYKYSLRIVVSHYPVTNRMMFGQKVNEQLHPHVFFCAHDHQSKFSRVDLKGLGGTIRERDFAREPLTVPLMKFDHLYEIYVPTCSYRMGTSSIGFGAAVIENGRQEMTYTVFWSSQRFPFLFGYLVVLVCVLMFIMYLGMLRLISWRRRGYGKKGETQRVPLLQAF